ncbi:MAG: hypothetical protein HY907_02255 [Deltaproteobacteria bacterium]|nr:hypothetical protein [Deltaproteobacteria bacterium]
MKRLASVVCAAGGVVALAFVAAGCPRHEAEWTRTPDGFVKISGPDAFAWRAVSPDGSAIAVRHRANEEEGSLAFWSEVFERELVEAKGYRLAGKSDVTSADGVAGKLLQLEFAQSDTPYHYGLAVYVSAKSIVTVETATELERLERYRPAFEAARRELRAKAAE